MRNKKLISIFGIFLSIAVVLVGCSSVSNEISNDAGQTETEAEIGNTADEVSEREDTLVYISKDEIVGMFNEIELTEDKWLDYFEIQEVQDIKTDEFGDETGEIYEYKYYVPQKDYFVSNDFKMKFVCNENIVWTYYKVSDDSIIRDPGGYSNSDIDWTSDGEKVQIYRSIKYKEENYNDQLSYEIWEDICEDLKLSKYIGTFYSVNIDEKFWNIDESGERFIATKVDDNRSWYFFENGVLKEVINGNVVSESSHDGTNKDFRNWFLNDLLKYANDEI